MEFVHEPVIERGKIFQAIWACFLQTLEKEDLCPGIELLKELAELSHGVAPCRDAQNIMHEALDKLLSDVFTIEIAIWELTGGKKLIKGNCLCSKGNCLLLMGCHAGSAP